MPFTDAANARTAGDLAGLDKKLDDFVRNIRANAVTSRLSRRCPLSGVKRTSQIHPVMSASDPMRTLEGAGVLSSSYAQ